MPIPDVSSHSIAELVSLEGRAAVVTGAARGIGRAVAMRLAEAGAVVVVADIDSDAAEVTADEIGGSATAMHMDAASRESVDEVAARCVSGAGSLDIWVNNAGIYPRHPFLGLSAEDWDRVVRLNLYGTFFGAKAAARAMATAGRGGVILNMVSTSAFRGGPPGLTHYASSKHGIVGLTKALALELGPLGIRVLALAPTRIDTEGLAERVLVPGAEEEQEAFSAAGIGGHHEVGAASLPLGRVGVPDDVARVALFCASDLSMFMTGATIPIDAGFLAV